MENKAHQKFVQILQNMVMLTDGEQSLVTQNCKVLTVPKGTQLTRAGQTATHIYFVIRGLLRIFYTKEDAEITGFIFSEGLFASCYESFLMQSKSNQTLECLEDCELISIHYKALQTLYRKVPVLNTVGRVVAEQRFVNGQRILASHLLDSAAERYQKFCFQFPDLARRVPQHILASYLGITPVSLSRIRKKISQESLLNK